MCHNQSNDICHADEDVTWQYLDSTDNGHKRMFMTALKYIHSTAPIFKHEKERYTEDICLWKHLINDSEEYKFI